jgi:hypothetical protein
MRRAALLILASCLAVRAVEAQQPSVDLDALVSFYGDNTELSNPFREGETLIGVYTSVFAEATLSDRLKVRAGVFANQRFGSRDAFDQVRPVLALVIGSPRSRLVLGTLETVRRVDGAGPDRIGPHDLLAPVQRETLAFERPWEAGLQWTIDSPRVKQDAWVHWQRLATSARREIFDTGLTSRITLRPALALRGEIHLVHQGGQLSNIGPVADSVAAALGVEVAGSAGWLDRLALEGLALVSRFVPDREHDAQSRTGFGTFVRAAAEESGWRVHGILWRACDYLKREGDLHYQSLRRDGTRYRGLRDYAEAGLTRTFPLASQSALEVSARWHRVENDYEYSFRVLAVARLRMRLIN